MLLLGDVVLTFEPLLPVVDVQILPALFFAFLRILASKALLPQLLAVLVVVVVGEDDVQALAVPAWDFDLVG